MSIKLKINLHTDDAVNEATQIAKQLKDLNLRGAKVRQSEAAPEDGTLGVEGYMPLIEVLVQSGFAAAFVTQLFGLLKNGFFTKSKEIASKERIALEELRIKERSTIAESNQKLDEIAQKRDYVDLSFECGETRLSFKLTKDDPEQQMQIIQAIMEMQRNCE